MRDLNKPIFISLFKEACKKCYGFPLTTPLSESDSKLLSNIIFEKTGLVVGTKSIKNYSLYVLSSDKVTRQENPSIATLDTIARYVLDAPYTNELKRKDKENHYPYWFQYRSRYTTIRPGWKILISHWKKAAFIFLAMIGLFFGLLLANYFIKKNRIRYFTDNFNAVSEDSLKSKGWILKAKDINWWNKRIEKPGHLALYTIRGDNWSLNKNMAGIKNLLIRRIPSDCFTVEAHLTDFIPIKNWQQAGIIISEDSTFSGKMIRLSISYNDFFGGYKMPPEIIVQVLSSSESGSLSKPEEIAHFSVFNMDSVNQSLVINNLRASALKIEKKVDHFRFLYSTSPAESFAFEEAASRDLNIKPLYVGIFAIQGWADSINIIPAYFDSFVFSGFPCN